MDDLKLALLVRRNRALIERARKAVDEARRQNAPFRRFNGEAQARNAELKEWAKVAAETAKEERIQAHDAWDRATKAITASHAGSSRSGRR